jgi:hypothetical protein
MLFSHLPLLTHQRPVKRGLPGADALEPSNGVRLNLVLFLTERLPRSLRAALTEAQLVGYNGTGGRSFLFRGSSLTARPVLAKLDQFYARTPSLL